MSDTNFTIGESLVQTYIKKKASMAPTRKSAIPNVINFDCFNLDTVSDVTPFPLYHFWKAIHE